MKDKIFWLEGKKQSSNSGLYHYNENLIKFIKETEKLGKIVGIKILKNTIVILLDENDR